jgi:hypothetical protein
MLNPIRKDDYTLDIDLFCNQLCKFIPNLTTKHMSEYKV